MKVTTQPDRPDPVKLRKETMNAQVRIERYADQGRCVGHIDGRVVFVRFALPGELVQVALDEPHDRDDRYWTGEVVEVIEPSPDRVDPAWPLAGPLAMGGGVGGADLVHVSLEGQLRWKAATISDQMSRLGHVDVTVPVERAEGDTENGGLHWRTRIEMIADDDGRPSMRRRGSHKRVPLDTMPLATDNLLAVADREHVWDGGFEPGSQIRLSVPGTEEAAHRGQLRRARGRRTARRKPASDGDRHRERYRDFQYMVDANGFWQVHRQAPVMLAGHVIDLANKALDGMTSACIWDLYSGAGLFTLPLATMIAERTRMLSVEGGKTAVKNAQRNLRALNLPDVDARCGDVSATLAHVPAICHAPIWSCSILPAPVRTPRCAVRSRRQARRTSSMSPVTRPASPATRRR